MTQDTISPWNFYQGWDVYQGHLVKADESLSAYRLRLSGHLTTGLLLGRE
jgi:hypothetical protein